MLFCLGLYFSYSGIFRGTYYKVNLNFMKLLIVDHFVTYTKGSFNISLELCCFLLVKLGFISILFLTNLLTFNFTVSQNEFL